MSNPFDASGPSKILQQPRARNTFKKVFVRYPRNMQPITLPGSSKYPPPPMQGEK